MIHKRPPRAAIIVVIAALVVAGYYAVRALASARNGGLQASGSIEAVIVEISPEVPGQVEQVLVEEGREVSANDALVVLDDSLLREQRNATAAALGSAEAASAAAKNALEIARARYQEILEHALTSGRTNRVGDWFAQDQLQFDQPEWYFSRSEQIAAMQDQVDAANMEWAAAEARLIDLSKSLKNVDFLKAERRVLAARLAYLIRKDVNERAQNSTDESAPVGRFNRTHCGTNEGYLVDDRRLTNVLYPCAGDENLTQISERLFEEAKAELEESQRAYDALLTSQAASDVLGARAEVAVAQESYYAALDRLSALRSSDYDPAVTAAQGVVDQAQSAYDQTLKQVEQAQAALDLIDTQIEKLTLRAPLKATVITRAVEPGEYVQPGAVSIILANLSKLTITVYVPEDRYGQISQGQRAVVSVDSFPGEVFSGAVIQIADEAEFTPRNVQTVEGRSATVYAIKLEVSDPTGRLKPGMPADVTFVE